MKEKKRMEPFITFSLCMMLMVGLNAKGDIQSRILVGIFWPIYAAKAAAAAAQPTIDYWKSQDSERGQRGKK